MNLKEAIKIHNELEDNEQVQKYLEALSIVVKELDRKAKVEYYKSSSIKDYYIELPYKQLTINSDGKAVYRKHSYNCIYKYKNEKAHGNYCLSLCNYTKEYIEQLIDNAIIKDEGGKQ